MAYVMVILVQKSSQGTSQSMPAGAFVAPVGIVAMDMGMSAADIGFV